MPAPNLTVEQINQVAATLNLSEAERQAWLNDTLAQQQQHRDAQAEDLPDAPAGTLHVYLRPKRGDEAFSKAPLLRLVEMDIITKEEANAAVAEIRHLVKETFFKDVTYTKQPRSVQQYLRSKREKNKENPRGATKNKNQHKGVKTVRKAAAAQ
ncbi:hypothetical protein JCM11641_001091 [Rhodosporidiobolus odoratus]